MQWYFKFETTIKILPPEIQLVQDYFFAIQALISAINGRILQSIYLVFNMGFKWHHYINENKPDIKHATYNSNFNSL